MMVGVIAFFTALPAIVQLISRLGNVFAKLMTYSQQNNLNGWIDDLEKSVDELSSAKNSDDKFKAAQGLVDVVRRLGPSASSSL